MYSTENSLLLLSLIIAVYSALLIAAKSSRYNSSGLLLRISSGNAAITRLTHSGSSMTPEPLRQLRIVFRR